MNNEKRLLLIDREINNSDSAKNYAASQDAMSGALGLLGGEEYDTVKIENNDFIISLIWQVINNGRYIGVYQKFA